MESLIKGRKLTNMNAKTLEEEMILIKQSEAMWWEYSLEDLVKHWNKLINNL